MNVRRCIAPATVAALFAGWVILVVGSPAPPADAAPACPTTMAFAVGGTGDPTGLGTPEVPAGPRTNISYPASISPVGGYVSGDDSIRIGSTGLERAVADFQTRCPDSQVDVYGHSLGAIVVTQSCARIQPATCHATGNPLRPIEDGKGGIVNQLPSFIPGFHFDLAQDPNVVDHCNSNDGICNFPNPVADPLGAVNGLIGYVSGDHGYPGPAPATDQLTVQQPIIPSAPLPVELPNLNDTLDPVTSQLVPDAPIRIGGPYVPTPVGDYLPPVVADLLPPVVADFVPPPALPW